ncbi:hypothetical protein BDV59DRAFT_195992 [Aspergillus ambiguus]|uniref:uncharacterized protein n=1 Tax=Aspergillus ambiguus TaxID=176160 RepID=UPI003CCD9772
MVSLSEIRLSNARVALSLPPGLVALFVGATSGMGEATLKTFAKYTRRPRAYFVGRSQEAADRIIAECTALNPEGEYIFVPADVSLIRVVDEVCDQIRARESHLNLLFLSAGVASLDRSQTTEELHLLAAMNYYSRMRFITRLLPLIQQAPALRRVVTVAAGGFEGPLDTTDYPALRVPLGQLRGHMSTLITLILEVISRNASEVALIHDYPGTVDTPLARQMLTMSATMPAELTAIQRDLMSPDESGERHMYLVTSARYSSSQTATSTTSSRCPGDAVRGTNGELGSRVYSVGWDGESASPETIDFLANLRERGTVEQVWEHTEGEFMRITGDIGISPR